MREGIRKGDRVQIIHPYTYRARGVKWELATPVNVLTADMRMSSPPGVIEEPGQRIRQSDKYKMPITGANLHSAGVLVEWVMAPSRRL